MRHKCLNWFFVVSAAFLLSFFCLFSSYGLATASEIVTPTEAETDVAVPEVVSVWRSTSTIDVTSGAATARVAVRLTDATGATPPTIFLTDPNTGQIVWGQNEKLTSGTPQNGVWTADLTVPQGSAAGRWTVKLLNLRDTLGSRAGSVPVSSINVTSG